MIEDSDPRPKSMIENERKRLQRLGLTNKVAVRLLFDSSEHLEDWLNWYLDGGGEQVAHFYVNDKNSRWVGHEPALHLEKFEKEKFR